MDILRGEDLVRWHQQQKWARTPIGAAYFAMLRATENAASLDGNEHTNDRRLKAAWQRAREMQDKFLVLLHDLQKKAGETW